MTATRTAEVERTTRETSVRVRLDLDGQGRASIDTGLPFFDHMLQQFATHAAFDLDVQAQGDLAVDGHHTVEDVGLTLGQALAEALGDRQGIGRFGHACVPMDEALVEVALDLSGRPFAAYDVPTPAVLLGTFDPGLTEDFVRAFATAGGITLHVRLLAGRSPHHIVEAQFKALARALADATTITGSGVPSTKGAVG